MFREIKYEPRLTELTQTGLSALYRCPLAMCSDTLRLVNVVCRLELSFDPSIPRGFFHEIAFEIEIISLDQTRESFSTQDRKIAYGYIPAITRPIVIDIVANGYLHLIRLIGPRYLFRVTKTKAELFKARLKHDVLTRSLENVGYHVMQAGTDPFGRGFWLMERPDD